MAGQAIFYAPSRGLYEAGFSGSVSVPDDTTYLVAVVQGAGGAGRVVSGYNSGGGGGAYCVLDIAILPAEWGTSLTLTVGSAVASSNGQASTLTGTLNGTSVSVSAGGGTRSAVHSTATGGTAAGGTTNINGFDGEEAIPADMADGVAGYAGGLGQDGAYLTLGTGGIGTTMAESGYIMLEWG